MGLVHLENRTGFPTKIQKNIENIKHQKSVVCLQKNENSNPDLTQTVLLLAPSLFPLIKLTGKERLSSDQNGNLPTLISRTKQRIWSGIEFEILKKNDYQLNAVTVLCLFFFLLCLMSRRK